VCVRERERERKRQRKRERKGEGERERAREREYVCVRGSLIADTTYVASVCLRVCVCVGEREMPCVN